MTKKQPICHDCGVREGELHQPGCDMERCPFCGGQLITCNCSYKKLGFEHDENKPYCGLPPEIYKGGLTEELEKKWEDILTEKGKIPYIRYPSLCAYCGKKLKFDDWVMYPDWEWERYIEPAMRNKIICDPCFKKIKKMVDERADLKPIKLVTCPFCNGNAVECVECVECRGRGTFNKDAILPHSRKLAEHQRMLDQLGKHIEESK